jgi:hypothetical protein
VEANTESVYDEKLDMDFYAASILLDRQVEGYLSGLRQDQQLSWNDSRNIRYYMDMLIGSEWSLHTKSPEAVKEAIKILVKPLPLEAMQKAFKLVEFVYKSLGGDDAAAKSADMTVKVSENA